VLLKFSPDLPNLDSLMISILSTNEMTAMFFLIHFQIITKVPTELKPSRLLEHHSKNYNRRRISATELRNHATNSTNLMWAHVILYKTLTAWLASQLG